jgi:hypothetical protein
LGATPHGGNAKGANGGGRPYLVRTVIGGAAPVAPPASHVAESAAAAASAWPCGSASARRSVGGCDAGLVGPLRHHLVQHFTTFSRILIQNQIKVSDSAPDMDLNLLNIIKWRLIWQMTIDSIWHDTGSKSTGSATLGTVMVLKTKKDDLLNYRYGESETRIRTGT